MSKKSVFGFDENIVAAFSYLIFFFSAILVLIFERDNKFVRFHAMQSFVFFLAYGVVTFIVESLPIIRIFSGILGFIMLPIYIGLILLAFMGKKVKIPVIGEIVWAQVNK